MAKSSSSTNKAFFLAVLMAVSVPSAALAWNSENDPDAILTVTVNMGSADAGDGDGGGESGCTGFSSMELSASVVNSRLDRISPARQNPTVQQRLAALGTAPALGTSLSINDTHNSAPILTKSSEVSGSWVVDPDWAQTQNGRAIAGELVQLDLSGYDGSNTISFSAATPSLAMIDRRTYVSSPFSVSYDASSCASDAESEASVFMERSNLQYRTTVNQNSVWESAELPSVGNVDIYGWINARYNVGRLIELAGDGRFEGEAYLLKSRTQSDGDRRLDYLAYIPFDGMDGGWSGSISGVEGTATLRAVTKLYGDLSQDAQLRTQYAFWLDVDPNENYIND